MGTSVITYNSKPIALGVKPYEIMINPHKPRAVNQSLGGDHEIIREPRVDVHVLAKFLINTNDADHDIGLRIQCDNFWQWAQRGGIWTFAYDSDEIFNSTLNGAVSAGDSSVEPNGGIAATVGDYYVVRGEEYQVVEVVAKMGSTLQLTYTLDYDFADGDRFRHWRFWSGVILDPNAPSPIVDATARNAAHELGYPHAFELWLDFHEAA